MAAQLPSDIHVKRSVLTPESPFREWRTTQLCNKPRLSLVGYSRAADKTFFLVPELNLALDAGECRGRRPEYVVLTHGHDDHSKDLDYILSNSRPTTCLCPAPLIPHLENYVKSSRSLNCCMPAEELQTPPFILKGVKGGDIVMIGKNDSIKVEVIDCCHAVPCVGFCFSERRSKLKEEYKGLAGKEIRALRLKGETISEEYDCPLFCYLGDTSIDVFEKNPQILKMPNIVVECTFLMDEEYVDDRCVRDGHIAWKHLEPVVLANPETTFILIHFSCRYTVQAIYEFFGKLTTRKENPLVLSNVVIHVTDMSEGRKT